MRSKTNKLAFGLWIKYKQIDIITNGLIYCDAMSCETMNKSRCIRKAKYTVAAANFCSQHMGYLYRNKPVSLRKSFSSYWAGQGLIHE